MDSRLPDMADDSTATARRWLPYIVFLAITGILALPILKDLGNWGIRDWDLFTTLHAAAVRSITEYGQFPFWNPYIGGGNILFAHPEVPVLNPLLALLLLFGPLVGLKLQMLAVYFLGLIGGYKLARQLGMSAPAAYLPPVIYMLSSYLTLHFAAGHIPFHYFCALPWLLFFHRKSLQRPVHILSTGGVAAFVILGSGAAVPLLFSLFFLFLFSLFDIDRVHQYRPPLYAVAAALCGIMMAAIKFFPMYDYLTRYPWIPEGTVQVTPLSALPDMFFNLNQSIFADHLQGYVWGWHEYGAYVSPIAVALALLAAALRFRSCRPYLAMVAVSILLVLGSFFPPWSPWDLLHRLPGFASIRVPSRFILLAVLSLSILAGFGADILLSFFRHRRAAMGVLLFVAITAMNLFVSLPILAQTFTRPPEFPQRQPDFRQVEGNPNRMYAAFLANQGTIRAAWLSAYRPGRGLRGPDNAAQEWYSEGNAVQVMRRQFTPNRLLFDLSAPRGGTLVISQGYDPGWRRMDGGEVRPFSDLVSCSVAPSGKRLELYYFPRYFMLGLWASMVSIATAVIGPILYRRLR